MSTPHFVKKEEMRKLYVRCGSCKMPLTVMAAPFSPIIAKVKCPKCGEVSEVQTRESAYREIEAAVERQKDRDKHTKRAPVTIHVPSTFESDKYGRSR